MERSVLIGPAQPSKVVHLERWTRFPETFPFDRADPFSFRPKFPEILVEWIALNYPGLTPDRVALRDR